MWCGKSCAQFVCADIHFRDFTARQFGIRASTYIQKSQSGCIVEIKPHSIRQKYKKKNNKKITTLDDRRKSYENNTVSSINCTLLHRRFLSEMISYEYVLRYVHNPPCILYLFSYKWIKNNANRTQETVPMKAYRQPTHYTFICFSCKKVLLTQNIRSTTKLMHIKNNNVTAI